MLDYNTFIFVAVAVSFVIVGTMVWIADAGISDKSKNIFMSVVIAVTVGLIGLFFLIDDDSQFEYAGYEKMKRKSGGAQRQSMMEEGGSGGEPQQQAESGGGSGGGVPEEPPVEEQTSGGPSTQEATAQEAADTYASKDCDVCPEMVEIAPGIALLGSPHQISSGGLTSAPTAQKNFHKPFSIGKYEVTVEEFTAFVRDMNYKPDGKCSTKGGPSSVASYLTPGFPQAPRHPVVCISWSDASKYTLWLSAKTGKAYRLPSEAEWEFAARSGITQTYMQGDELNTRAANFRPRVGNRHNGTTPVGSYPPNTNGMHDVHGNAWEIVAGCWSRFYQVATSNHNETNNGLDCSRRIVKGGAWSSPKKQTGFPMRGAIPKELALDAIGFRVMREDRKLPVIKPGAQTPDPQNEEQGGDAPGNDTQHNPLQP